jgi:ATP-dependent exoDNAse (exonuclease V) alpha subunit
MLYGVRNGTFGTVLKIDTQSRKLTVMLDSRERTTIKLKNHPLHRGGYDKDSNTLGYASTTHKAQGMTVKNAYILTDEAIQDREITYVQMSRAKVKTQIYTTSQEAGEDLLEMEKRMNKSRQKQMALEIV